MLGQHTKALLESGRVDDVTRAEYLAAKAADANEAIEAMRSGRPIRTARIAPRRFASPAHCVAAMAELMATRAAANGAITADELLAAGFSATDIALRLGDAQIMAAAICADRVRA